MKLQKYFKYNRKQVIKTGIYKIYHKKYPNKFYVGSAGIVSNKENDINQGFYLRWRLHIYYLLKDNHHNIKLQNMVNKHGINDLRFEILEYTTSNVEDLTIKEQYWMDKLNVLKNGYNIFPYARTSKGRIITKTRAKSVIRYNIKGEVIKVYKSAREASRDLKCSYKVISSCCLGETLSYKNSIWRFANDKFDKYKININPKNRTVLQYSLTNEFIKEWESITEINKKLNISIGNLSSCVNNKRNQAGGFIWKKKPLKILKNLETE